MYNWSVNTKRLRQNPEAWDIFQLEQMINFGLNEKRLSEKKLRKYWDKLKIDDFKRKYLERLLWPNKKQ
ncbi:MAG: hypothetical protein U9Q63_00885 [Patescibacteria group bacterium]|nr:hypothetical protein [Patescibacteria group bacterium]